MADDLLFIVGEKKRISHQVSAEAAFAISAVTAAIYNEADTAVVSAAAGAADPGTSDTEHEVYFVWDTAGVAAGDYRYLLSYTVGALTEKVRGRATVLPVTSKLDRYVDRIIRWLQDSEAGEAQRALSYRDYMDALSAAVHAFSEARPRVVSKDVTLAAADWEYLLTDLTADITPAAVWVPGFSTLSPPEPDVDAAIQARSFADPLEIEVDEERAVWRWRTRSPSAGDVARVKWKTIHTLSHTVDTVYAVHGDAFFDSICQFSSGVSLIGPVANEAVRTMDPQVGEGMVAFRDRQTKARQQGMEMMAAARKVWKKREWYV